MSHESLAFQIPVTQGHHLMAEEQNSSQSSSRLRYFFLLLFLLQDMIRPGRTPCPGLRVTFDVNLDEASPTV